MSKRLTGNHKAPILCFVGPPGVGKTSLARSIATATQRKYVRFSLGGLRDEAEIRGHRRTYIGSMPGKMIQNLCKSGVHNPLMLLDEIDKLGHDSRGDPSSALLEVLDPEQNMHFNDLYLDVDYDLSQIMFICTANTLNIPDPLLDRMEIIEVSGYTEDEKFHIARQHLLPKQLRLNGLEKTQLRFTEGAIRKVIRKYTRESGVRALEKSLTKIIRKCVYQHFDTTVKSTKKASDNPEMESEEQKKLSPVSIAVGGIESYLGAEKFLRAAEKREATVGIVNGLAWTQVGGDTLTIETLRMPGKGEVMLTGSLGDVMKESIKTALSIVRSRAHLLGIEENFYREYDFHVHVPAGATPKDGPSAGIGMCVALVSTLTGIAVRNDCAMTGEITLRGRVLPVGGIKEKLLAAYRDGLKTVIIPADNHADLEKIPNNIQDKIDIQQITNIEEAIKIALVKLPDSFELHRFSHHHNLTASQIAQH